MAGARVEVLAAPRAGCTSLGPLRATAGYNGRGADANLAGVTAALRNDAAAQGADAIVIRERALGAPTVDSLSSPRGATTSGGCPNCVAMTADVYRCPKAPAPPASVAPKAADGFAEATDAALAAAAESARRCLPAGSRGGDARVRVTFAPSGDVVYAEVEGDAFTGTPAGACFASKLRNAHVPPFAGAARSIDRTLKLVP
ncbi:sodium:dicarboxylate symporter [Minicystis rosea]|nr:sodium:dicarboxylate symporter [Minicystis rosea]